MLAETAIKRLYRLIYRAIKRVEGREFSISQAAPNRNRRMVVPSGGVRTLERAKALTRVSAAEC
jgi:hypothetical protein